MLSGEIKRAMFAVVADVARTFQMSVQETVCNEYSIRTLCSMHKSYMVTAIHSAAISKMALFNRTFGT